ncbi:hypothetical protein AVEN_203741-1 [Araneus ventricosus]|uniref:Uncharacterized protein n=1 Tax=Araneus ventricosus TaxID=182803 RepID=A0A4Y2U2F0_ARAVE|nr:hypothetical protein AVEN_203741-1 [Araneus ventricosus]
MERPFLQKFQEVTSAVALSVVNKERKPWMVICGLKVMKEETPNTVKPLLERPPPHSAATPLNLANFFVAQIFKPYRPVVKITPQQRPPNPLNGRRLVRRLSHFTQTHRLEIYF